MTCATCADNIEKGLSEIPGIEEATVNFASEKLSIKYDPAKVDLARIKDTVSQLGYGVATRKSILPVAGMTCASCVARVEEALSSVPGVISASVNLATEKATVEYLEGTQLADVKRAAKDAGYELGPEVQALEDVTTAAEREIRAVRNRFIIAAILATMTMVLHFIPPFIGRPYLLWALATPMQFWAGWPIYRGAWGALKHKTSNMNTLIALGTSVAYFSSVAAVIFPGLFAVGMMEPHLYFDVSAMIIALIVLDRFLVARARGQTSAAIKKLIGM
jgi:Cu+-exporting ATPase